MLNLTVFRVILPLVAPIVARPGQLLAVWPDSPTHTLAVYADGARPRRLGVAYVPAFTLHGLVREWAARGVIVPVAVQEEAMTLPTAEARFRRG